MTTEQADPWTVLRLLEWTTQYFKKRGSESARLDAEVLLAEARGSSRIELYTAFNSEPTPEVREAFRELVRRRGEGTPVAYLVGHKEFYSVDLRVTEATLIPRPETEHVVIEVLDHAKLLHARLVDASQSRPLRITDVGTGTGAIAVAVAKNFKECRVTAIDKSPDALAVATYNVEKYDLQDRVQLVEGDLLTDLPTEPLQDIICSNPPYVSEVEFEQLSPEVANFEPKMALVGGQKGTEMIERLVVQAVPRLANGGQLIIELSPMIADQCVEIVTRTDAFEPAKFIKDLAGHRRVLSAKKR
jgi:release factor glutamine methyltransferase